MHQNTRSPLPPRLSTHIRKTMAIDLATLISFVSAGTSIGSIALATVAFRRSSPRLRIMPDEFAYRADPAHGGRLTIDVRLANFGDKPARVSGVSLVALAPLRRGSAPDQLSEPLPGGVVLVMPGRRASSVPLGPLPPFRLPARRSTRWQQTRTPLDIPDDEAATTIKPFDGIEFTAPAPWSVARNAHWLRFEVRLVTGEVLHSAWWRNWRDVIESYQSQAASQRSLKSSAHGLQQALGSGLRRARTADTDQQLPSKQP